MKIVNKFVKPEDFAKYLADLPPSPWHPSLVVVHHCSAPNLKQRPDGFTSQHMLNLQAFYEGKNWSAGPHLFIDDHGIWVFSPLTARGVHAVAFNAKGVGIEMLGDYDNEDPWSGRGLSVLRNTRVAVNELIRHFGMDTSALRFHREDPGTSKTCPGTRLSKAKFATFLREP